MDRTLRTLTRPRRVVFALAVGLFLSGSGIGLFGLVSAASEDGQPVHGFEIPWPHVGDRGRYEVLDGRDAVFPLLNVSFEWKPDRTVLDREELPTRVNVLRLVEAVDTSSLGGGGSGVAVSRTGFHLRAGTVEAVAEERFDDSTALREGDPGLTGDPDSLSEYEKSTLRYFDLPGRLPCGLRNPLQGQILDLTDEPVPNGLPCETTPSVEDRVGPWTPVEVLETPRSRVVVFEEHLQERWGLRDWEQHNRYWMQEGVPYPIRIESRTDGDAPATTGTVVHELVSFTRGSTPVTADATAPGGPLPPLEHAPRADWGLPSGGAEHPFSLEAAYRWALDDPDNRTLADFLDEHPDAYMLWATHSDFTFDHSHRIRWSFAVTDGTETLVQGVQMRTEPVVVEAPVGVLGVRPVVPVQGTESSVIERTVPDYAPIPFGQPRVLAPDELPDRLPTVASLWAQWDHVQRLAGDTLEPNSWGFLMGCYDSALPDRDGPCARGLFQVWAGHHRSVYRDGTALEEPARTHDASGLHWRGDDLFGVERSRLRTTWIEPGQATGPSPRGDGEPVAALMGLWRTPGAAAAAGITLAGVLAALTYWLWPVLKAGPAALFSRVRDDELLQHPVRARIVEAVRDRPGIHHQELVRKAGTGTGAAEHHLRKLEAGRFLTRRAGHGYTCYFPYGQVDRRLLGAAGVLRADAARRTLQTIADAGVPGPSSSDVARALGLSNSTVHHHIQRLRAEGLVDVQRHGPRNRLVLTDAGSDALTLFAA